MSENIKYEQITKPDSGDNEVGHAVKCQNISKSYIKSNPFQKVDVKALKNISFEVEDGEIFGIIGPDGAGKTTLFRILTTLLLADNGSATVNRRDVVKEFLKIRNEVGYMPGRFSLYQDLTVEENLDVFARVFKTSIEENYYLVEDIYKQLEPFRKRRAGKLSGGMKQKLALCCALIHKPKVLFLDEPTTGVDPVSRKEFWEMLKRLKKEGITILVSTPYMDEASLCDRIALIQNGSFLKIDTPENIVKQFDGVIFAVQSDKMYNLLSDLRELDFIKTCYAFGEFHHVTLREGNKLEGTMNTLSKYMYSKGHSDIFIKKIDPTVEDCFMELMSKDQSEKNFN